MRWLSDIEINGASANPETSAPLTESVPPSHYGGTERVVSWLTEELVSLAKKIDETGELPFVVVVLHRPRQRSNEPPIPYIGTSRRTTPRLRTSLPVSVIDRLRLALHGPSSGGAAMIASEVGPYILRDWRLRFD